MHRLPVTTLMIVTLLAAGAAWGIGNAQEERVADLLIPLPPPGPKVKQPLRHPPPPKAAQEDLVPLTILEKPIATNWRGIYDSLPRDAKGVVDWMRALKDEMITPRAGIDPDAPAGSTTDEEIVFTPKDTPTRAVTFRHATHTQWLGCKNCHSAIFKKKDDNLQFTHDDMDAGKYCGTCHGKTNVVVLPGGCNGCHPKKAS